MNAETNKEKSPSRREFLRRSGTAVAGTALASAVTARSYHAGAVHCSFMDGSVRDIADSIDIAVWRALGTRAGNLGEGAIMGSP